MLLMSLKLESNNFCPTCGKQPHVIKRQCYCHCFLTLIFSASGTGRKSVLYKSAFSQLASISRLGRVADMPIIWTLHEGFLRSGETRNVK